jgi:hypothetical protein
MLPACGQTSIFMVDVDVRHSTLWQELQIQEFLGFGNLCFVMFVHGEGCGIPLGGQLSAGGEYGRTLVPVSSRPPGKKSFQSVVRWPIVLVDRPGETGSLGGWAGRRAGRPRAGRRAGRAGPWVLGSMSRHDVDLGRDMTP